MESQNLVAELVSQLGPKTISEYMHKTTDALDVFTLAFEDGKVSRNLYEDFLAFKAQTGV